ncbi:MAG: ABC transporter ATP-binding protein [Mycoplasmoidaceae bacterium]
MNKKKLMHKENTPGYIIELKDVSKIAKTKSVETIILEHISLKIKEGSFTVIIGKSGSGKTTLMNLMSGMTKCSGGELISVDSNLSYYSNSDLINFRRENVSFIFQDYGLLSTLNVIDNIRTGIYLSKNRLLKSKVREIITFLDLQNHVKKMPNELSGGQQQRVSIARALVKNPKIIFGDEPTGSLDSYTSYNVLETLKKINKSGTTIVLVTHDSRVAQIANQIIEISDGKIISDKENKPLEDFKKLFI